MPRLGSRVLHDRDLRNGTTDCSSGDQALCCLQTDAEERVGRRADPQVARGGQIEKGAATGAV